MNGRILILDVETTGIAPLHPDGTKNDSITEIGIVELVDGKRTHNDFQQYLYPDTEVSDKAYDTHGLSRDDLKILSKGLKFKSVSRKLLDYIGDDEIVAHNAKFDMSFLDAELQNINQPTFKERPNKVSCTFKLAQAKYPGQRVSLDSLCRKFGINLEERKEKGHGALLDSELLAEVFILMSQDQKAIVKKRNNKINTGKLNIERLDSSVTSKLPKPRVSQEDLQRDTDYFTSLDP